MRFDPIDAAAQVATAAQFETLALGFLGRAVGYDVAFMGLRGATMTSVGLARDTVERAVRPGVVSTKPNWLWSSKQPSLGAE